MRMTTERNDAETTGTDASWIVRSLTEQSVVFARQSDGHEVVLPRSLFDETLAEDDEYRLVAELERPEVLDRLVEEFRGTGDV